MPVYEEKQITRRAWLILLMLCVLVWAGLMISSGGDAPVWAAFVIAIPGTIAALTLYSIGRYGNVRLTERELRSGRDRFALSDLVPGSVSGPGEPVRGKLVGGAYAPTLGTSVVGVLHRDGRQLVIQTKNPDALRAGLSQALAAYKV